MSVEIFKRLAHYLKFYKFDLSIALAALICVSGALLGLGVSFKYLVDRGLNSRDISIVNHTVFSICILIGVFGVSSFFRSYFINNLAEKMTSKIRIEALSSLLKLDITHYEELKIGDIITRLTSDIELIGKLIIDVLSFFLRNLILTFGSLILMFYQAPKLSLIVIVIVPIAILPILKLGRYVRILSKQALHSQGLMASLIEENFTNIKTLYAFNQQYNKINEFQNQTEEYLRNASVRLRARSLFFALSISIVLSSITIIIWMGSRDIIAAETSSGALVSFIYYSIAAGMSIGGIAELFSEIQKPLSAAQRVFDLITTNKNTYMVTSAEGFLLNLPTTGDIIDLEQVSFSYPSRPEIQALSNISFKIKAGSFTGIVGRSGSGKSTIFQLLMKFYTLYEGRIKLANKDLAEVLSQSLRGSIAYVPQEPSIFSGSLKSNIAFSKPEATDEMILEAAELAGVMDFARLFKEGLNTEIGEKGVRLSGGQKQRIAIARALLYGPEILLLDEATSSLDSEGEQDILKSIRQAMRGKVIISIAHRISALENADQILVIDKGHYIAQGTHEELLNSCNIYRTLYKEQML